MVYALGKRSNLQVESAPGTVLNYITFNTQDSALRDVRVRQAIAYAMNRPLIIHSLWRDRAHWRSLLPPEHWAWTGTCSSIPMTRRRRTRCWMRRDGSQGQMAFVSAWR